MYYSKKLCEQLLAIGCISESGEWWSCDNDGRFAYSHCKDCTPTFWPYDFCGPSKQCHKNAEIRWPHNGKCFSCGDNDEYIHNCDHAYISLPDGRRHAMIDLPEEEQEAYMIRGLK